MHLNYREDPVAGAGYLSLAEPVQSPSGRVKTTFEYNIHTYIDFDADGKALGIEFLSLPPSIDDTALLEHAGLSSGEVLAVQTFLAENSGKS